MVPHLPAVFEFGHRIEFDVLVTQESDRHSRSVPVHIGQWVDGGDTPFVGSVFSRTAFALETRHLLEMVVVSGEPPGDVHHHEVEAVCDRFRTESTVLDGRDVRANREVSTRPLGLVVNLGLLSGDDFVVLNRPHRRLGLSGI